MYTAKRSGRGISVFYDPALEAQPEAPAVPASQLTSRRHTAFCATLSR